MRGSRRCECETLAFRFYINEATASPAGEVRGIRFRPTKVQKQTHLEHSATGLQLTKQSQIVEENQGSRRARLVIKRRVALAQAPPPARHERPSPLENAEEVRIAKAKPLTTDAMSVIETRRSGISDLIDPLRPVTAFRAVGASESVGIWALGHPRTIRRGA